VSAVAPVQKKAIRFRARSFVAFALTPEKPLDAWLRGIDKWLANSPGFFTGRPVVLSLTGLQISIAEVGGLVAELAARGIRIFAIEGDGLELGPELPPLLKGARSTVIEESTDEQGKQSARDETAAPRTSEALIIDTPIRSGQSVFHPQGDVVVLGSVGSGSEVMAGGSIHVYGTLRGRAFAGALGSDKARIFCQRNEAELLAINGWYRAPDDMEPSSRGKPIQAFLKDGKISVVVLD
jgi:septum site-determining protein MinC